MAKKSWPAEVYQKVSVRELILVSLYKLGEANKKASFEELLDKCFELFPEKFSLAKYPDWPDSRKLDRPLRSLRREKLVSGHPKEGFVVTKKGQTTALKAIKLLRQKQLKLK